MPRLLVLATTLVVVLSQTLTDISTLPPTSAHFAPFTIASAQAGFYDSVLNRVIFPESGAGTISAVSFIAPSINASSFPPQILNAGSSLDFVRGDGTFGGDVVLDTFAGPLALRAQGDTYFQQLGLLASSQYSSLDSSGLQNFPNYTQRVIFYSDLQVGEVIACWESDPQPSVGEVAVWSYTKLLIVAKNGNSLTLSWNWYQLASRKTVLSSGWNSPNSVIEGANGGWFVSEGGTGSIWRVPASNPSKNDPTSKALFTVTNPQQLLYDPSAHRVYVASGVNPGSVVSYDVIGGATTTLISGLKNPVGLASDSDTQFSFLYVSERVAQGHVSQFNLQTQDLKVLANVAQPQFLTIDPNFPNQIFFPSSGVINRLDISKNTPQLNTVYTLTGAHQVLIVSPSRLVITGVSFIDLLDFPVVLGTQPLFIGIGHVPYTLIDSNGYATVTGANYPINVKDAPFGGGITITINHPFAWQQGWTGYSVFFNNQPVTNPFGDYKWGFQSLIPPVYGFVYTPTSPTLEFWTGYTYPIRNPADLWANPFWGGYIDTTSVPSGLTPLKVRFWKSTLQSVDFDLNITIDNIWPQVSINQIRHYNDVTNSGFGNVGACAIVQGTSPYFNFNITVKDPDKHLLNYALNAVWGDNKGEGVYSASYPPASPNPAANPPIWQGVIDYLVPQLSLAQPHNHWNAAVSGDSTSTHCAHTFILGAWDRSINGWGYIHYSSYTYSVTFLLS